ncbi:MAG: HDOD domain-containing protein [Chitinispirillaceae bacterium]
MMDQNIASGVQSGNERYSRIIESIDSLPSLPSIVMKLMQVVNSPDTSAEDAAELIERDPALTSKMIRLANSAFYGIPRSISSVSSAVVILGFNTIRSLVLSATVVQMFEGVKQSVDTDRFWKHSIVTAMTAKTIVRHFMSVRMMDPESAFCAGILHDIGKLIFSQYTPDDYQSVYEYARDNSVPLVTAEETVMGINHAQVGKILADRWALPIDLEYCLIHHHSPENADKVDDLVNIIHLSNIISHQLGCDLWEGEVTSAENEQCREVLKIKDDDFNRITAKMAESLDKSDEFMSVIK